MGEMKELKATHSYESEGERVCEVCGIRCKPDELADYQAHLNGKVHHGYTLIRAKVAELRERLKDGRPSKSDPDGDRKRRRDNEDSSKDGGRYGSKDGQKGKDEREERTRSKDRERDRDRERGKRERKSNRSADRRSRSRDRRRR